jgi:hypothetical protein
MLKKALKAIARLEDSPSGDVVGIVLLMVMLFAVLAAPEAVVAVAQ